MIEEKVARLRTHNSNIIRYRRLLETDLSDLERGFIEKRLNEERSAVKSLANHPSPGVGLNATPTEDHSRGNAAVRPPPAADLFRRCMLVR